MLFIAIVICWTKAQIFGLVERVGKFRDFGLKEVGGGKETPSITMPDSSKLSSSVTPSSQSNISSSKDGISTSVGTAWEGVGPAVAVRDEDLS